jgi:hypothetical protein
MRCRKMRGRRFLEKGASFSKSSHLLRAKSDDYIFLLLFIKRQD